MGAGRRRTPAQLRFQSAAQARRGSRRRAEGKAIFESRSGQNRYAILYRIATAKRAETRSRVAERFVAMPARGETIHPHKT
jgi:hypothetical protein